MGILAAQVACTGCTAHCACQAEGIVQHACDTVMYCYEIEPLHYASSTQFPSWTCCQHVLCMQAAGACHVEQQLFAMCAHCCMAYYTTQQYNSTQCVHILSCIALPAPRKHQNTGVATCKISSSVPQFTYVPTLCARTAKNHRSDQYLTGSPN